MTDFDLHGKEGLTEAEVVSLQAGPRNMETLLGSAFQGDEVALLSLGAS